WLLVPTLGNKSAERVKYCSAVSATPENRGLDIRPRLSRIGAHHHISVVLLLIEKATMRWLANLSMQFRGLVLIAALALLILGAGQLRNASVEALPEFSPAYVEVQTEALGLSAYEVEQLITVPLEVNLLNGVAWLEEIRSNSVAGLSSIEMIFEPG